MTRFVSSADTVLKRLASLARLRAADPLVPSLRPVNSETKSVTRRRFFPFRQEKSGKGLYYHTTVRRSIYA